MTVLVTNPTVPVVLRPIVHPKRARFGGTTLYCYRTLAGVYESTINLASIPAGAVRTQTVVI